MHRILLFTALCLLAVISTGCKTAQLRRQMKELIGSTIVLPEKITCVYNGEVYPMPDSLREKAKQIIYIDSTECTTCRISHLWEYQDVFEYSAESGRFEVMIVLSNMVFDSIPLVRYLVDRDLDYPVYVDMERRFLVENPHIPQEKLFHSFLLDSGGQVIFVGDPALSERMLKALGLALDKL